MAFFVFASNNIDDTFIRSPSWGRSVVQVCSPAPQLIDPVADCSYTRGVGITMCAEDIMDLLWLLLLIVEVVDGESFPVVRYATLFASMESTRLAKRTRPGRPAWVVLRQ
jgi:hypothetical protein